MIKPSHTVLKETKYIICFSLGLSVLMQVVFLLLKKWDYTVLTGNLLSAVLGILNFYFMGLSIQKAVDTGDEKEAKRIMKNSQTLRTFAMFIVVVIGTVFPFFSTISVIIPLFFVRIAVAFRPLWKDEDSKKEVHPENETK